MATGLKPEETGTFSLETEQDLLAWRAQRAQGEERASRTPRLPTQEVGSLWVVDFSPVL